MTLTLIVWSEWDITLGAKQGKNDYFEQFGLLIVNPNIFTI